MSFDPTITFGAVLNALVLLVGFVVAFTRIGGRLDLLNQRLDSSETATTRRLESIEGALKEAADRDRRLTTLEERVTNHARMMGTTQQEISDLRRGQGFIQGHRRTVDGEWPGEGT